MPARLVQVRQNSLGTTFLIKRTVYQLKVDVSMLNAVKSVLADILGVGPLQSKELSLPSFELDDLTDTCWLTAS